MNHLLVEVDGLLSDLATEVGFAEAQFPAFSATNFHDFIAESNKTLAIKFFPESALIREMEDGAEKVRKSGLIISFCNQRKVLINDMRESLRSETARVNELIVA